VSDDQSKLAVYGAERASDGALTLVVINKTATDLTSSVSLSNFSAGSAAQVWRFTTAAGGIQRADDVAVAGGAFTATFPAQSMSMVVVPAGSGASQPPTTPPPSTETPTPALGTPLPHSLPVPIVLHCVVPKLKGLTLAQAKKKLRNAHCRLGKVTKKHSAQRKGRVIAQKPKPRARLKAGTKVAVVLSRG
jgi:hypothetical protein